MNKTVTLGLRTLRGPGIPKGNDQVIYSNTVPDRLSYRTQPSKADSSSSTAGNQARNPNSSRQPTPTEGWKRMGVHLTAGVNPCILSALGNVLPKLSLFSLSLRNSKTGHSHPSIGYHKAKILDISFRESSHNTLKMTRPRALGARSIDKQTAPLNGTTGTQGPPRLRNKPQMTFRNSTRFPEGRFSGHERLPSSLRGTSTETEITTISEHLTTIPEHLKTFREH
ncbi:hypothetical protein CDL15_Pgr005042 [Punica granatum]|uniref:Uncharacterized protein n=1 Tax=Punica granatum TaxID=22663 RepID=A0A218WC31_PUNGR|nr:hypothetical protein CDL15_Pgr005042 [Punica granatum]